MNTWSVAMFKCQIFLYLLQHSNGLRFSNMFFALRCMLSKFNVICAPWTVFFLILIAVDVIGLHGLQCFIKFSFMLPLLYK